ncbi:MAG TPA: pyridoxamine 5'-phosphate oxidase family protein [Segetibacter sp.]|nr:pyridoxamine 5'-phosphate oxidase family protein [Segetibacter sp.]
MNHETLTNEEAIKKLKDMVDEIKVCMFATVQEDYSLFSRPMQSVQVDEGGNIWFFTNEYSGKVDDISKENTVYLMYSHPGQNSYLHIKGKASVVNDKEKIKELWSPIVKAWFPKGIDDPALSLLRIETNEASYWDGASNKFVVFFNILKAIVKGEKHDQGEFGEIRDINRS